MDDLLDKGALAQAAALESRAVSAEELMQATLARIAARNPAVNAIVSLRDEDALLAEARAADNAPRKGWLHGLPMAVKDLANVAGLPTSMGSPIMAGQMARKDDLLVARMRAAGALFIGKTNTPEFGLGSHTFNPVHGATGNAYDPTRSAGGSSGGAAVALACKMVAVADGSDMMGSLRNPAGWNNVYGFRPSWGRVPDEAQGDTFLHPLATNGPMARNPRDLAALLEVQSGPVAGRPFTLPKEPYLSRIDADMRGRRVAWLGDWGGAYPMEAGVLETCEAALKRFDALGVTVEALPAPFDARKLWQSWLDLRAFANANRLGPLYGNPVWRKQLKATAIWEIETGHSLTLAAVQAASLARSEWYARAAELFDSFDALILPTAQVWPFPLEVEYPTEIAGLPMDTYHRWMEVVIPASLIGLPALAVPAGFGAAGLPMGLQLIGRHGNDLALLQLAEAWHQTKPQERALTY
ncbi:amidase [Pararhodobacter zhoushanensis]|uniref:Amidase n=1 Tax=Pararhodobacter zhoushanensis TaxID=2479545 RepID=A0ABT3H067_9RHOB|nr:amidase [Pararhodobacter zhoushanensis]MCW1933189.1 amidase [Pararhodobacter zhoushanensis]